MESSTPLTPQNSQPSADGGWLTRERALVLVLIAATVLAVIGCYLLVRPFLAAIAWALALAVVARPLHGWIAKHVRNRALSAGIAVAVVVMIFVVPIVIVVHTFMREAQILGEHVQTTLGNGHWQSKLDAHPRLAAAFDWFKSNVDLNHEIESVVTAVRQHLLSLVNGSVWALAQLLIILLTLYYFFRDQEDALNAVRSLFPLSETETNEVFGRVGDTIHATIYGTLFVALIQGTLGGLMFWLLGLPAPVLWGVIMALAALVPYLGTFVVWVPAAIFLAVTGSWGKALILTGWGGIVVALIDNLLYPMLVGKEMRLHTLLVFFAIVGGIVLFGASGIILGPVLLAVTDALLEVWRRRTAAGRAAEKGVSPITTPTSFETDGAPVAAVQA